MLTTTGKVVEVDKSKQPKQTKKKAAIKGKGKKKGKKVSDSDDEREEEEVEVKAISKIASSVKLRRYERPTMAVNKVLDILPDEIVINIFSHVRDIKDICMSMLVCRGLYSLLQDNTIWFEFCKEHRYIDAEGHDMQAMRMHTIASEAAGVRGEAETQEGELC
jgi:hypothetical protein